MTKDLTIQDLDFILETLEHTRRKFETNEYPSEEIKQKRLQEVAEVAKNVRAYKQYLKAR